MARVIAFTALGALGLSGAPVHEPVHGWQQAIPMTVTQRDRAAKSVRVPAARAVDLAGVYRNNPEMRLTEPATMTTPKT